MIDEWWFCCRHFHYIPTKQFRYRLFMLLYFIFVITTLVDEIHPICFLLFIISWCF